MAAPPGYVLAFSDEFDGPLSVSNWGYGTKWIAHTPYNGDFGKAKFGLTADNLTTSGGNLVIKWSCDPLDRNKQQGGLLSSAFPDSSGFGLAMGYWESRIKFPVGPGVWGAFWVNSVSGIKQPRITNAAELDIIEYYGGHPTWMYITNHRWGVGNDKPPGGSGIIYNTLTDLTADFHVYGCLVDSDYLYFYFDGKQVFRGPTFPEACGALYVMVDFGTTGESTATSGPQLDPWGFPLPNPSYMLVDYVRAYSPSIGAGTTFFPALYLDTPDQLGPVAGIIPNVTPLSATGSRQGDQLGIYQNLIDQDITFETIMGITDSLVVPSNEYRMRRGFWRQWSAYDAIPTPWVGGMHTLVNATLCLACPASATTTLCFIGKVPEDTVLADGAVVRIWWSSAVTTGNTVFGVSFEKQGVTPLDTDDFDTTTIAVKAAPSSTNTVQCTVITQAHLDGMVLGDVFRMRVQRLGLNGSDTLAGAVNVYIITIEGAT